jgi:uncharacterized protein
MTPAELIGHVRRNPVNRQLLDRLPSLALKDGWLVSGALFQTVWNHLTGRPPEHGIVDYDLVYFDGDDLSRAAEDRTIARIHAALADIRAPLEIRNQARVHIWYPGKFGRPYPALNSARESIDRYLAVASIVGLQAGEEGRISVYAPQGLDDIANLVIRPNPGANFCPVAFAAKANRWQACWPELTCCAPSSCRPGGSPG